MPHLFTITTIYFQKDAFFSELNKKLYHFIWNKKNKIKRTSLELDLEQGGLKMISLEIFSKTLKVKSLELLPNGEGFWTRVPGKYIFHKIPQ